MRLLGRHRRQEQELQAAIARRDAEDVIRVSRSLSRYVRAVTSPAAARVAESCLQLRACSYWAMTRSLAISKAFKKWPDYPPCLCWYARILLKLSASLTSRSGRATPRNAWSDLHMM